MPNSEFGCFSEGMTFLEECQPVMSSLGCVHPKWSARESIGVWKENVFCTVNK